MLFGEAKFAYITVPDKSRVFYRYLGDKSNPPFLLLHGFPSSSFQFRNLIPQLADHFYVIAPDLPGFGFTEEPKDYIFTFENLSKTIETFIDALGLQKGLYVYIFDYGAPTMMRIFARRPGLFSLIVSQNGNAYNEGLGDAWEQFGIRSYWREPSEKNRNGLRSLLSLSSTKMQYDVGNPNPDKIHPETYMLDFFLANQRQEAMLDLFGDYKSNIESYPEFSRALREQNPRVLAIWGSKDPFFVPAGAEAFARDISANNFRLVLLDTGHFALESHNDEIAQQILSFVANHEL